MRRVLTTVAACLALGLFGAACSSKNDSGGGSGSGAAPTTAAAQATGTVSVASSSLGDILVDDKGKTLYVFTKDTGDQSACSGQCADNWPALTSDAAPTAGTGADSSKLGVAKQADGKSQVTYDGHLLYFFAGDTAKGDTKGQGLNDVWWVVGPDGQM